jgi:hypothetical protein
VRLEANADGGTSALVIVPNALLAGVAAGAAAPIVAVATPSTEAVADDVAANGAEEDTVVDLVAVEALAAPAPPPPVTQLPPPPVVALRPEPARTASGLERRVPGTHLPERGPRRDLTAPLPARSADGVRRSLRSFQHGTERALAERDDEAVTDENRVYVTDDGEEQDR